jgi:hypothetical protein
VSNVAEQGENLTDHSFLYSTEVERAMETEEGDKALTLKCTYYESPDDLVNKGPKEIKLWTYRDEAIALAKLILRIAQPDASRN